MLVSPVDGTTTTNGTTLSGDDAGPTVVAVADADAVDDGLLCAILPTQKSTKWITRAGWPGREALRVVETIEEDSSGVILCYGGWQTGTTDDVTDEQSDFSILFFFCF